MLSPSIFHVLGTSTVPGPYWTLLGFTSASSSANAGFVVMSAVAAGASAAS